MPQPSSPLPPLRDRALDDDAAPQSGSLGLLGRPAAVSPLRERVGVLLARIPISPGRLLALTAAGAAALLLGLWLLRPPPPAVESTLPRASSTASVQAAGSGSTPAAPSTQRPAVVVDAAGSVRRPGLYRLEPGARVDDLIRAAGGLRAGADAERLNLAAPLADGQRVYVPKIGQLVPPAPVDPTGGASGSGADGGGGPTSTTGSGTTGGAGTAVPKAPIDLNAATSAELETLPGIGPTTAAAILAYRSEHGPFRSVDELIDVRGIGDAKLAALRTKVRV